MFLPDDNDVQLIIKDSTYSSSDIYRQLLSQHSLGLQRTAVFTDIHESWDSHRTGKIRKKLDTICKDFSIPRISLTGYGFDLEIQEQKSQDTILFDILVSSAGTRIDVSQEQSIYTEDDSYKNNVVDKKDWNRTEIVSTLRMLILEYSDIHLEFQEGEKSPEKYRVSMYFRADSLPKRDQIEKRFRELFNNLKVIVSDDRKYNADLPLDTWPRRFCMDILPVDKLDAASYLIKKLDIKTGIAVGNATNDLNFLLGDHNLLPVLVGGSTVDAKTYITNMIVNRDHSGPFVHIKLESGIIKRCYMENDPNLTATESVVKVLHILLSEAHDIPIQYTDSFRHKLEILA